MLIITAKQYKQAEQTTHSNINNNIDNMTVIIIIKRCKLNMYKEDYISLSLSLSLTPTHTHKNKKNTLIRHKH